MNPEGRLQRNHGVALVTALMITLIIIVLGAGIAISSRSAVKTENSFKSQQRAFEVAVAGLEHAREVLRECIFEKITGNLDADYVSCSSLTARFAAAAGNDSTLIDASRVDNFNPSGGFSGINDVPLIGDTSMGGETYRVYLTNDPWDNQADPEVDGSNTNGRGRNVLTLTAFARGANNVGFSAVQGIYRTDFPFPIPGKPGVVTLPGPSVNVIIADSAQASIDGAAGDPPCFAAIATSTTSAKEQIILAMDRPDNYTTCDPSSNATLTASTGSVENFIKETEAPNPYPPYDTTNVPRLAEAGDPATVGLAGCVGDERDFIRVQCLQSLVSAIQTEAARVGYVGTAPSTANLGTPTNPKIAVVPGDFSLPPGNYGGILVVTGNMTMQGNAAYTGLILVIGNGTVVRNGGGAARLCGGMLVADVIDNGELNDPGDQYISSGWVGAPDYRHNGGGTTEGGICKDAGGGDLTQWSLPLTRLAFQQLR